MKKRLLPLLLAAVMLLASCGNVDDSVSDETYDELSQYYGTDEKKEAPPLTSFTLPILQGQTLDPVTCSDGAQQTLGALLYEGLFELDPQFEVKNVLAESYSYDAASYTYNITLHSGVTFSDGSELSARDVEACLERAQKSERYAARLADVASISAPDSQTVRIRLKKNDSGFAARLDIPIVKSGTEQELFPVGTGPYVPQSGDNGALSLVPNGSWWQQRRLPLQTIPLLSVKDNDTMAYTFYSREIQLLSSDLTATVSSHVSGDGNYTDTGTTVMHFIGCNATREALKDPALRQALSAGIDRVGCVNSFLMGHGIAAQFPLSPLSPLYPADLEIPYSPDTFMQSLEKVTMPESGKISLTMLVNEESSFKVSMAQKIASDLSRRGLEITIRTLPWDQYLAALNKGDFDLYYGEYKLTADWDLSPLLLPGGAVNYGRYSDETTTNLVNQYLSAEGDARASTMLALCRCLQQQSPILPVCFKQLSVLVTPGAVDTITPTAANPFYDMSSWTVHVKQ
jgi:peptide/nickel transport system substrate-binding protein